VSPTPIPFDIAGDVPMCGSTTAGVRVSWGYDEDIFPEMGM